MQLGRKPRPKRDKRPMVPVASGRAKRLLGELPEIRVSHSRVGSALRLDWDAVADVNGWFLTVGTDGKEPVYRESFAADVLTTAVPEVADTPVTVTLVALRRGKPVARTRIPRC
jgi:hypothetical protein